MFNTTWRIIGRVLISLILFTTAFEKLQYPEMYKLDFSRSLGHFYSFTNGLGLSLPNVESQVVLLIKFSGLLDAFIAALIFLGSSGGAVLAVLRFIVGLVAFYLPWSTKLIQSYTQRQRFANNIALLGVALLLTRR